MNQDVPIQRVFRLSAFEGLKLIRKYSARQPGLSVANLVELIERVDQDGRNLDLEAGGYLHTIVDEDCSLDSPLFYQTCIKAIVIKHQPVWTRAMRQGRKRFVRGLLTDDVDVFTAAGLMLDPPPISVVSWWDDVVGHAKLKFEIEKMEQARFAEKLSIDSEIARLKKLGLDMQPDWMGLDDNFAGYDVLSHDIVEGEVVPLMIEVKSTTVSPLRFYLTRNEWNQAEKIGESYIFHVWDMAKSPPILHVRTLAQVAPHIPDDNNAGKWSNVEIPLGPG
jgi:hypothetical protein